MKKLVFLFLFICINAKLYSQLQTFHDTQGQLEISATGQATFTLPIALPPSIQDVGPTINLSYASGQSGGIAGQGWNINGISMISRISTRINIDGFVDGVDFDDNDKLALDGQRLIQKTGFNYWLSGCIYETETQSNIKIEQIGIGENMEFVVTQSDGSRSWYSAKKNCNLCPLLNKNAFFYIYKYLDANGNQIEYFYEPGVTGTNHITSTIIKEIKFSYNIYSNTNYHNSIVFNYKNRQKVDFSYFAGNKYGNNNILDFIQVFTKNSDSLDQLFRKYQLNFIQDDLLNEKISSIVESNGAGEVANPIQFTYEPIGSGITIVDGGFTSLSVSQSTIIAVGEVNDDGICDFISGNYLYSDSTNNRELPFTVDARKTFFIKTLLANVLKSENQLLNIVENQTTTDFNVYGGNLYLPSINHLKFTKTISIGGGSNVKYLPGDFNGDGITEVLRYEINSNTFYLIDLNPNSSTVLGSKGFIVFNDVVFNGGGAVADFYVQDFDGDGKDDILQAHKTNLGFYRVFTFKTLITSPWVSVEVIGKGFLGQFYISSDRVKFGDFNGDGKTDFMHPINGCIGNSYCSDWKVFYSNPKGSENSFFELFINNIVPYPYPENDGNYYSYLPIDANKDGVSDLVRIHSRRYKVYNPNQFLDLNPLNDDRNDYEITIYIKTPSGFGWKYSSGYINDGIVNGNVYFPVASNQRLNNLNYDLVLARDYWVNADPNIRYISFNEDFLKSNNLSKVIQSGGAIVDEIYYNPMDFNSSFNPGIGINVLYPNVRVARNLQSQLVSKLKNTSMGIVRFKEFRYFQYNINYNGLGALGFSKTANTSWYSDTSSTDKIWNVSEFDFLKRGALTQTYICSVSSNLQFGFVNNPITQTYVPGLISKSENTYYPEIIDNTTKKYTLLLDTQTTIDYLTNIIKNTKYQTYFSEGYNLPNIVVSKNFLGTTLQSTTTTSTNFNNSIAGTGFSYYIGRPSDITKTIQAYGDTKSTNEKFIYTNGNITSTEKRVGTTAASAIAATEKIIETMTYHPSGNGNLMSKSISASGFPVTSLKPALAARTTSYTYDATNRFVKTTTDVDGVINTNDIYDPLYGVVLKQTNNTLAQSTTSIYDNWGKRKRVTDFLGNVINYNYVRDSNYYYTFQTGSDDSSSFVQSDVLARVVRKASLDINDNMTYISYEYDINGRKIKESLPYFINETPIWNTFLYDQYDRNSGLISTSKIINTTYNGLTTTIKDGVLTKISTIDSNSNVITTTENTNIGGVSGGTITNSYNALGNLISSNYDGIITSIIYDLWGRKTQLTDPSAGVFIYQYNAFGEIVQETNPNGKTDYLYTSTGKISSKRVYDLTTPALKTNMTSVYNYDATYKWLNSIVVTNPIDGNSTYAYTYDIGTANGYTNTKQLKKTVETLSPTGSGDIIFTKEFVFDPYGRVLNEKSTATAHGQTSIKNTTKTYFNGFHYQTFDGLTANGNPLWQANTVNAQGQLKSVTLGNGLLQLKTYDVIGNPITNSYTKPQTNIHFSNVFDSNLHFSGGTNIFVGDLIITSGTNNLTNRLNKITSNGNIMETNEDYTYDGFDRLISERSGGNPILNADFSENDAGFVPFNQTFLLDSGTATQILENGKLKISTSGNAGTKKLIFQNALSGKSFKINADLIKISDSSGWATLHAKVLEVNSITQEIMNSQIVELNSIYNTTQNCDVYIAFCSSVPMLYPGDTVFTLDTVLVTEQILMNQSYDNRGKIITNELGTYTYTKAANPYQNTSVNLSQAGKDYYATRSTQTITYNAFQSPVRILENGKDAINFGYNAMQQRMVMYYGSVNPDKLKRPLRKYYSADGSMEIKYSLPTTETPIIPAKIEFYTYIDGDVYNAPIISRKIDSAIQENFYLHRDYQGSILAITNSTGIVIEKRLFDAWGNITKIQDAGGNTLSKLTFLDRGYTGHEHLQSVVLINMNARLYDPKIHRLLGPDNFITNSDNSQDYNRYAYARNNPLKYVDPSGNHPVVIGVIIAVGFYAVDAAINNRPINFAGILQSALFGAVNSAFTFGIGSAVSGLPLVVKITVQATAHGLFQGGLASVQGGKFWNGFSAGCLSSLAASIYMGGECRNGKVWNGLGGNFGGSAVGTIAFGTIAGGAGAHMSGGNFWKGAVTGLIVSGLNHNAHSEDNDTDPPTKSNLKRFEPTNSDGITQEQYDNLSTFEKMMTTPPGINASSGGLELIGGPVKGIKYLAKMAKTYPGSLQKIEQIGSKFWKYTTQVAGDNGMTIHTKILNMNGKTMKYFHDTYNSANKFMHRGWTEGSIKVHQWWNGVKQYGQHFFQNR